MTPLINNQPISRHEFCIETKRIEKEIIEATLKKVEKMVGERASRIPNVAAQRICNAAFEEFKTRLEGISSDKSLLFLTFNSREKVFFGDLKNRTIAILKSENTVTLH